MNLDFCRDKKQIRLLTFVHFLYECTVVQLVERFRQLADQSITSIFFAKKQQKRIFVLSFMQ
jgi:hypothetical protein